MKQVKQKQYSLTKHKFLTDEELESLEMTLDHKLDRNSILIQLALATGARASELLSIERRDLDPDNMSVFIKGLKSSNDRELPLKKSLFMALWRLSDNEERRPFPISYSMLNKIWQEYRPVKKSFHSLRHTFAINLYKRRRDIRLVQLALGHRSINNTMIYANYEYSQKELRKLIA